MCIDRGEISCSCCTLQDASGPGMTMRSKIGSLSAYLSVCMSVCRFMHGGDKDQGPRKPDRFASTSKSAVRRMRAVPASEMGLQWMLPGALHCVALHRGYCNAVIEVITAVAVIEESFRPTKSNRHGLLQLLRPHSSMHDAMRIWLDPCGLTVSCQTCTLAGSTDPQGPVLPGACAKEKKKS